MKPCLAAVLSSLVAVACSGGRSTSTDTGAPDAGGGAGADAAGRDVGASDGQGPGAAGLPCEAPVRTRIATWEVAPAKGPGDPVSFTVARVGGAEMIYVVDGNGGGESRLLRTADRGQSWCVATSPRRPVGLIEGHRASWYLATESTDRSLYQLWRSRDEGRTWTELGAPLPEMPTAVWTWPSQPAVVWARTTAFANVGTKPRDRDRLWRGQEGGGAWELLAPQLEVTGWKDPASWYWVQPDPRRPERLLALLTLVVKSSITGIEWFAPWLMQSDDRGATWVHAADVPDGARVHHAYFDDQEQLVVIRLSGEMSVRARDGQSWSTRGRIGQFEGLWVIPGVPGAREMYAQGSVEEFFGPFAILKSVDQGVTWTRLYEAWPPHTVVAGGAGALTIWDAAGARWSDDDGQSWRPLAIVLREGALVVPGNARSIYARNSLKVMASHDGGETWDVAPLRFDRVWSMTVSAADPQRLVAVIQGAKISVQRSVDGGRRWQELKGLIDARPWDGLRAVQETAGTPPALVASDSKGTFRSTDDGATWTEVARGGVTRFHTLASHPATIFARAFGDVGRSTDGGLTWQWYLHPTGAQQSIGDLAIDPADASTVYAIFQGRLIRAPAPGEPWTDVRIFGDRVLPSNVVADGRIALSADRPGTIMVVDGNGELIGSGDGGRSWFTFDELPRGSVRSVAFGPQGSSLLYVMTTVGLFKTRI
jgi:photosystem II stability/assembly factor-like uncharacterized protein